MTIWGFSAQVSRRLLIWSGFSIAAGLLMLPAKPFWRGFGAQAIGWGVIDAGIALAGQWFAQRRQQNDSPALRTEEARNLKRLLWINAGLDVVYILGGLWWARHKRDNAFGRGTGWGIVVQGAFLLLFDVVHARCVPDER